MWTKIFLLSPGKSWWFSSCCWEIPILDKISVALSRTCKQPCIEYFTSCDTTESTLLLPTIYSSTNNLSTSDSIKMMSNSVQLWFISTKNETLQRRNGKQKSALWGIRHPQHQGVHGTGYCKGHKENTAILSFHSTLSAEIIINVMWKKKVCVLDWDLVLMPPPPFWYTFRYLNCLHLKINSTMHQLCTLYLPGV